MEKNLADFLAKVQARTEKRREKFYNAVTLNYEIEDGVIRLSYSDIQFEYGFNLYSVMEQIAIFTNNNLNCGCTFTVGF